ncbi:MAG: glycosyltransferase family 39 protein, partial [Patescibacteria group bacterium]|nr:glycosyltransferase family 39 protein [Patescibacteria group bacterium]
MPQFTFHNTFLFVLLAVLVLGASLYSLTGKPAVWFDEGIFLHTSRVLAEEGRFGVQVAPDTFEDATIITVGYPLLVPVALATKLFGPGIFTARMIMVLFIMGFVACFFLLAKRLYGHRAAFLAAFLLASFAPLYGVGKSVIGEVPGLFFFTFGLLFLHTVETQFQTLGRRKIYAFTLLAGLGFGLAASTKPAFLVLVGALIMGVLWRIRFWKQDLYVLLSGAVGFALPLIVWMRTQFGSTLNLGWILEFYANPYQLAPEAITGLITTNLFRFVTESTPVHFTLLLLGCVVFFAIKFYKKETIHSTEIVVLVFVLCMLAAYLRTPGWYRYFFPAHVMLFLFLPAALVRIERALVPRLRFVSSGVLIALIVVQLGHFYQEEHGYSLDTTARARIYMQTIIPESHVLFYNSGELSYLYPHKNFSQYFGINDGLKIGEFNLAKLESGAFDMLAIPGAYLDESVD